MAASQDPSAELTSLPQADQEAIATTLITLRPAFKSATPASSWASTAPTPTGSTRSAR